jgi:hypothetical protein
VEHLKGFIKSFITLATGVTQRSQRFIEKVALNKSSFITEDLNTKHKHLQPFTKIIKTESTYQRNQNVKLWGLGKERPSGLIRRDKERGQSASACCEVAELSEGRECFARSKIDNRSKSIDL